MKSVLVIAGAVIAVMISAITAEEQRQAVIDALLDVLDQLEPDKIHYEKW